MRIDESQRMHLRGLALDFARVLLERFKAADSDEATTVKSKGNVPVIVDGDGATFRKVVFKRGVVPDYRDLVGKSRGHLKPIGLDEIPEFDEMLTYVRSISELEAFLGGRRDPSEDVIDAWVEVGVQCIGVRLAERHAAIAGLEWQVETAAAIYNEIEGWLLQEELELEALFPILNVSFDADRIDLAERMRVERVSDELRRAMEPFAHGERRQVGHMFTHVLVRSGLNLKNATHVALLGGVGQAPEDVSDVEQFFHALGAHTRAPTGWVRVDYRPVGWSEGYVSDLPPVESGATMDGRIDQDLRAADEPTDTLDAGRSSALANTFTMVTRTGSPLQVPTKRLTDATRRSDTADALLDLCIGIEALVGDNQGEVVHKIAFRCAAVLAAADASPGVDPWEWIGILKKVYGFRSRIAHGNAPPKGGWVVRLGDRDFSAVSAARFVLQELLRYRVEHPDMGAADIDEKLIAEGLKRMAPAEDEAPNAPKPSNQGGRAS